MDAGGDAADIAAGRRHARSTSAAMLSANFAAASTCSAASRFLSSASARAFSSALEAGSTPRRAPSPAPCRRASPRSISPPRRDRRAAARIAGRPRRFACDQPWPETFMKGPVRHRTSLRAMATLGREGCSEADRRAKQESLPLGLGRVDPSNSTSSRDRLTDASRPLAHSRRSRCVWTRSMTRESASPMHGKSGSRTSRAARSSVTASSPQARPSRRPSPASCPRAHRVADVVELHAGKRRTVEGDGARRRSAKDAAAYRACLGGLSHPTGRHRGKHPEPLQQEEEYVVTPSPNSTTHSWRCPRRSTPR